jgi:hypothetical protein
MFKEISTGEDINDFIDKTNSLHDGYIIDVKYSNHGITKIEGGYWFHPEQTKLVVQILVTSIWDTIIEIEFENLLEWQIKDNQWDITDTTILFNEIQNEKWIIWADNMDPNMEMLKKGSYAIAKSMKWRKLE